MAQQLISFVFTFTGEGWKKAILYYEGSVEKT